MPDPKAITGVVLAGGKSSRFGSNKALCRFGNQDFLSHSIDLLRNFTTEVIISGYYPEYLDKEITVLEDEYLGIGPLGGIYTALKQSSTTWILVVTCDMPLISQAVITKLLQAINEKTDIIGWHHETLFTTFPMLISKKMLLYLEEIIQSGKYRVKQLYDWDRSHRIMISDELLPNFANINTQKEYKEIIR